MGPCALAGGTPSLVELGRLVPGFDRPGYGGLAVADFDHDGLDDLVVSGANVEALFQVFGRGPGGIVSKQAIFLADESIVHVAAIDLDGQLQLVTISPRGSVRRFAGWPLAEVQSFELDEARDITGAAMADMDGDGAIEIVTITRGSRSTLSVYSLEDGQRYWSMNDLDGAYAVLPAQLDGDPALEIVVASTPGLVIDGATQATDWSYPDGFGWLLADARSQAAGTHRFLATPLGITMFQGAPWAPHWTIPDFGPSALATHDFDSDGFDDILKGRSSDSDLQIIDGRTLGVRLSIPGTDYPQAEVVAWDHDGDGLAGVAFTRNDPSPPGDDLVRFVDAYNGSTLWAISYDQPRSYQRLALARTASGLRLVYPTGHWGYDGSWVEIDATNGQPQWQSPLLVDFGDPFKIWADRTEYTKGGPYARQLLLAGDVQVKTDSARIIALDASTHELQWVLDEKVVPGLSGLGLKDIETFDLHGSPTLAACVSDDAGARMFLINAPTGVPLWNSAPMPDGKFFCELMAGTFVEGAGPLAVAILPSSLNAYDPVTRELEWTLPGEAQGASLVEHGLDGREIVVFNGTELRFHDAATRAFLRSFDLGQRVTAVQPVNGDVHHLVVAANRRLLVVDGANGGILQATGSLGPGLGLGNQLPMVDLGNGFTLIGVGSEGGVFRYRLYTGSSLFIDGFEPAVD